MAECYSPQGPVALRSSSCGPKVFTGHCNTASIRAQDSETGSWCLIVLRPTDRLGPALDQVGPLRVPGLDDESSRCEA